MRGFLWRVAATALAAISTPWPSVSQTQTAIDARSPEVPVNYADWIRPYQTQELKAWFGDQPGEVKLVVTAIEGDDKKPERQIFDLGYSVKYGCAVSTDGRVSYFSHTSMGSKGSGFGRILEADQKRLDGLTANLPDDGSRLPPPSRRLVIQAATPSGVIARVYDRANAPDSILEILRLAQSNIRSFVLSLPADKQWKVGEHGALAATADGRGLIAAEKIGPFRFWDPDSHAMLQEIARTEIPFAGRYNFPVAVAGMRFNPDGSMVAVEGDYTIDLRDAVSLKGLVHFQEMKTELSVYRLFNPQFTPDDRYLLIQSDQPALLIYDTRTLQRVASAPGLPPGAVGFFPAPHSRRPVYVTAAGEIAVWDEQEKRNIALLDSGGSIMRLAYSPDESMVAVATLQDAGERSAGIYRMRVWRTGDGALVQELRPYEQMAYSVGGLLWSPDGKYVLASTKAFGNFINRGIGIWEVQTGRHRGDLTGCAANVTGLASLAGGRIFEGCGDGTIREWNISEVMTQVSTFIASLAAGAQGDGTAK